MAYGSEMGYSESSVSQSRGGAPSSVGHGRDDLRPERNQRTIRLNMEVVYCYLSRDTARGKALKLSGLDHWAGGIDFR